MSYCINKIGTKVRMLLITIDFHFSNAFALVFNYGIDLSIPPTKQVRPKIEAKTDYETDSLYS